MVPVVSPKSRRKAQAVFREETLAHMRERPLLERDTRYEDMLAKTAELRELRMAKQAAELEAAMSSKGRRE